MDNLNQTLTILSSMVTPVVLILASSSLIMTTSQRLGRVIERTRKIAERFRELAKPDLDPVSANEEKAILYKLLEMATRRAKLLQKAMMSLYMTLSIFVATSVTIGIVDVSNLRSVWIPLAFGFSGAGLLFYASLLLIAEARIAVEAVNYEMDFALNLNKKHMPEDMKQQSTAEKHKWFKHK